MKKIATLSLSALLFNTQAYAHNRCLEMIEQRVNKSQLNLAQCELTSADATFFILS